MARIAVLLALIVIVQCCSAAFTVEHVNFIQSYILIIHLSTLDLP